MTTLAESTLTMTARISQSMKDELDALARSTGRNRNTLVQEALRRFLDLQRWQIAEIEAGIREADAGIFVSDEEIASMWAEFGATGEPPLIWRQRTLIEGARNHRATAYVAARLTLLRPCRILQRTGDDGERRRGVHPYRESAVGGSGWGSRAENHS